jgi:hypothetical protein
VPKADGSGRASIQVNADENYVVVDGNRTAILGKVSTPIKGAADYVAVAAACRKQFPSDGKAPGSMDQQLACSEKAMNAFVAVDAPADLAKMAYLGLIFADLLDNSADDGSVPMEKSGLDISKVVSARGYQVGKASQFGIPAIFEYYGANGLLGRELVITPYVVPCK